MIGARSPVRVAVSEKHTGIKTLTQCEPVRRLAANRKWGDRVG